MLADVKNFMATLDKHGFNYDPYDELEKSYHIMVGVKGDNTTIRVHLFFSKTSNDVSLKCFDYVKVPDNKYADILILCNALNAEYRWEKFFIDEDSDVIVNDDGLVYGETAGEESFELAMRLVDIADEVYPRFMKALWS